MADGTVDMARVLKQVTFTVRMPRVWVWRRRVATLLVWLAAWVLGLGGVEVIDGAD